MEESNQGDRGVVHPDTNRFQSLNGHGLNRCGVAQHPSPAGRIVNIKRSMVINSVNYGSSNCPYFFNSAESGHDMGNSIVIN